MRVTRLIYLLAQASLAFSGTSELSTSALSVEKEEKHYDNAQNRSGSSGSALPNPGFGKNPDTKIEQERKVRNIS